MHPDRDTTALAATPRADGRKLGLRCIPELRRELKVAAARRGMTMEDLLHRILCAALLRADLDPDRDRDRVA